MNKRQSPELLFSMEIWQSRASDPFSNRAPTPEAPNQSRENGTLVAPKRSQGYANTPPPIPLCCHSKTREPRGPESSSPTTLHAQSTALPRQAQEVRVQSSDPSTKPQGLFRGSRHFESRSTHPKLTWWKTKYSRNIQTRVNLNVFEYLVIVWQFLTTIKIYSQIPQRPD